ncbi:MAG: hypothetical protein NUW37_03320 [Planctomycetes bacterium]|nr:hypothetical protein [Planctomycetota bacterium]
MKSSVFEKVRRKNLAKLVFALIAAFPLFSACSSVELKTDGVSNEEWSDLRVREDLRVALSGFEMSAVVPIATYYDNGPRFGFGLGYARFGHHGAYGLGMSTMYGSGGGSFTAYGQVEDTSARTAVKNLLEDSSICDVVDKEDYHDFLIEGTISKSSYFSGASWATFIPYICTLFIPLIFGAPLTEDMDVSVNIRIYDDQGKFLTDFGSTQTVRFWHSIYATRTEAESFVLGFENAVKQVLLDFIDQHNLSVANSQN